MPAAAVANFTPAITGMSGMSVGASGEMADDMGKSEKRQDQNRSSWPDLFRPSTSFGPSRGLKTWMPGTRPGMTSKYSSPNAKSIYFFAGAILESAGLGASLAA